MREEITRLAELAPLHNPAAVAGIDAAQARFPGVPQVAAFDTAFHASMPQVAATYPIPWEWTTRWDLRRFGFHGLSVEYSVRRARELLGRAPPRLVVCHLGAGCSLTAVADGRSISTSMGFTPLEGVMMARRSGSIDPGLLLFLLSRRGMDPAALDRGLNEQSGLLGVSGISADMRQVLAAAEAGQERAVLARDLFVHRLIACVGAMVAVLRGVDALVFTGGIGEHSASIRAAACEAFGYVGLRLERRLESCRPGHRAAGERRAHPGHRRARGSVDLASGQARAAVELKGRPRVSKKRALKRAASTPVHTRVGKTGGGALGRRSTTVWPAVSSPRVSTRTSC